MITSTKRNNFKIVITLNKTQSTESKSSSHQLSYKFSQKHTDTLIISKNVLTIHGSRSKKPNFDEILTNNNSEVFYQIIKSLTYAFITYGEILPINKIECFDKDGGCSKLLKKRQLNNLNPTKKTSLLSKISASKIELIFSGKAASTKYFYAASYLIRSFCTDNEYDSFEKLWKAYNAIYRTESQGSTDYQCLNDMENLMLNNPQDFPLSTLSVSNYSATDLLEKTQWYKMLETKFGNKKANSEQIFANFLVAKTDSRLAEIAQKTINFKNGFWTNTTLYNQTQLAINNKVALGENLEHIDVVATLTKHYMYFLRNKSLHGDQLDHAFRIVPNNKEELTVKFCSSILAPLIVDLINRHTH
ncbi:hypothetical protein SME17J_22150 [Serratia marcescens]|nr:hypothetical protein SME17J_22150 [Serratia marcescens]